MARERVVINIEVNSDVATIEATRKALERLTNQNRDLNDEYERHTKRIRDVTKENKRLNRDSDIIGNSLRNLGRSSANASSRFNGFRKSVFSLRKDLGGLISAFGGIIGMVNKLSLVEIPLLAAGMAGITVLFKSGTGFVNLYKAAMSSLAYTAAAVGVAVTTVIAAMREFQSVQFAPMYAEGAVNTADRFAAASGAMKMFVDNTRLAVVGSESLNKAFGTLSKQKPVTGGTVAAFEGLMNIVAGSGGDIGKGSEKLAEFLAQVQKGGLGSAAASAKELGPDFEKIIKEAQGLGIKTSDEFFKAAAEGALGETFQKKYAGQLDALNDTLIGRFKTAMQRTKNLLSDVGDQFLQPAGEALMQIQRIIERTILQLTPMIKAFGTEDFIGDAVNLIDRASVKFVGLMTRYLGTAPGLFEKLGEIIDGIGSKFEKVQDWARQFVDAGQVIIDSFIRPVFDGLMDKFGGGMNVLAELVEANAPLLKSLADSIVGVIGAIGEYGNMLKEAFIAVIPLLNVFLKVTEKIFSIWTKISSSLLSVFGGIGGGIGKALAAVPVLYGSLVLFSRFFKVFGGMFGKDMSIKANNVYVNGSPVGRGGPGSGPYAMMGAGGLGTPGSAKMGFLSRVGNAATNRFRAGGTLLQAAQAGGVAAMRQGKYAFGRGKQYMNAIGGGNVALLAGGMLADYAGQQMGGTGGQVMSAAGQTANVATMAKMLGVGTTGTGLAAIGYGAYKAGDIIGGKFKDDSVRSRATAGLAGAAGGAAVGAAIGSFIPVIGTGVGAAIGAVVGGVKGYMKAGAARREAREAAKSVVDNLLTETDKMFAAGDVQGLQSQMDNLKQTIKESAAGDINTYNQKIAEQQPVIDALNKRIETYTKNASLAEKMFNTGTDKLNKLAEAAGLDLQNNVLNFTDMLKLVGKTAQEQSRIVKENWAAISGQALGGALSRLDRVRNRRETQNALDAAQAGLVGGNTSESALLSLIESQIKFSTNEYGDLGGAANAYQSIMAGLTGEELGFLDEATKKRLQDLTISILDPKKIVADMDPEALATLVGGADAMKGMTPEQIIAKVNERMEKDPTFLANFATAQAAGNMNRMNALITGQGGAAGFSSPYGFMPATTARGGVQSVVVNVNAPVIDPTVVRKIKEEIEVAIRTAQEKGGTYVAGGRQ